MAIYSLVHLCENEVQVSHSLCFSKIVLKAKTRDFESKPSYFLVDRKT